MTYATLEQKIRALPESCLEEVSRFVDFMAYKVQVGITNPKPKIQPAPMREIKIPPSLDDPLDSLNEDM